MSKIFDYSKIAENQDFVGRKTEISRLSTNFVFLTNTIIIAPQGWGKSSLVNQAAKEARHKEKSLRFCYLNLSNTRNEEHFYELLVRAVLRSVCATRQDVLDYASRFFGGLCPKVAFTSDSVESLTVDFDWNDIRKNQDLILDFPCRLASETGLKLVICVDDFHNIDTFQQPESLVERIQARWKTHTCVGYCVCGQGNAFMEKFSKSTPMFYRHGEVMNLGKIKTSEMVVYIREKFADNAKYLDNDIARYIAELVDNHPFYVQQLAHLSWLSASVVCSREVVRQAHETIVDQMGLVFKNLTASLTTQQLCYLHAILEGETIISTAEVLHRHHITSATSASRSKTALLERGIICNVDGKIVFSDPIYSYWLKNRYF